MLNCNKLFVAVLLALLTIATCKIEPFQATDVEKNVSDSNLTEIAVLTLIKVQESNSSDTIYTYKCSGGNFISNRLACKIQDSISWSLSKNIEWKFRCPGRGSGPILSYFEIIYSVTSQNAFCYVSEGRLDLGYIGVTVQALNTYIFNFSANFYTI